MNRFISLSRSIRARRSVVVLLVFCSLLPLRALLAQAPAGGTIAAPPTTITSTADQVNEKGYSLKPASLATNEWPVLRIDFSIERADKTIFKNLTLADVDPKVDGKSFSVREGDLIEKSDQGVFVLLDGSGSMTAGVNKLGAAKQGIKTFIDNIDATDKVGLIVFDEEPRVILPPTTDKERVKQEVESFTIRPEKSKYTRLYDAVEYGLARAGENNIRNLVLISDGWEDTLETRSLSAQGLEALKRKREQDITRLSRDNHVRVFSVAIGDENGKGLSYVDRKTLDTISQGANGGVAAYIELKSDLASKALAESVLQSRFQQIVEDLKRWFQYSYSLTLRVDRSLQTPGQEHKLWVGFTVGDNPRIQLPVEYTYMLQAEGPPVVTDVKKHAAIFIRTAPRTVTSLQLLFIYFALLFGLVVLGLIPSVTKTLSRGTEAVRLRKAIATLESKSPLLGMACPNEGTSAAKTYLFKEGDVVMVCPGCGTPHHLSCWILHQHQCMQRNCLTELIVPEAMLERHGLTEHNLREETSWMTS